MKETTNNLTLRHERGQSLILALLIMFLLVFLGGVFVALIARNVGRTKRSSETLTADYLAEAGIRYASDQLTYSEDGADWRPVPSYPAVLLGLPSPLPNPQDPDYEWLMQGYSRFTYGNGRFLLRVTYDPNPHDPISKYIRIESVGRIGIVDQTDPTTWDPTTLQTRKSSRLRAERVAYKAIGITDYSRFITNKDRRPGLFSLGAPGFITQFGVWEDGLVDDNGAVDIEIQKPSTDPATWQAVSEAYGGSIRVNGDLLWHGTNDIWVNPLRGEDVEVAGDIQFDVTGPAASQNATQVRVNQLNTTKSSDPYFNTLIPTIAGAPNLDAGVYRDARQATVSPDNIPSGPRNIMRLEPPLIDARGPAGGVSRYREVTRNSGEWVWNTDRGEWFNTGFYGWGAGIYIDNRKDIQPETELGTLRNEWMTPGSSQYWMGPYYIPPGVVIVLTPYDLDNDPDHKPDMLLIRSDATPSNPIWYGRDGNALNTVGGQLIMPYPDADSDPGNGLGGVIFAEGNVRIKGTLPPNTQLTVVSGGTIYVEGSILKYPWKDPRGANDLPLAPNEPRDSAIALLATNHVCVNTTQFFGPMAEGVYTAASEGLIPVNWRPDLASFISSVRQPLYLNWAFGADPTIKYVNGSGDQLPVCAYVRHAAAAGDLACYMNMSINHFGYGANPSQPANGWWGLYEFGPGFLAPWNPSDPNLLPPNKDFIYPLADITAAPALVPIPPGQPKWAQAIAEQKWPMWEHQTFTLLDTGNHSPANIGYTFYTDPGAYNSIGFHLDQNFTRGDYLLSRLAVQPCDIRIEALMYAQNGSFFIIPGEWFNPDTNDTELIDADGDGNFDNDANGNRIPDYRDMDMKRMRIDDRWPFYAQPLDCQVTIQGAISENVTASIAEVSAWMDKWGWIPLVHGCSTYQTAAYREPLNPNDPADTRRRGLTIVYDSELSYPRSEDPASPGTYKLVRTDDYSRPLPLLPKLPVSPDTLYFGRPT
jgi:hypothetical protein